MSHIERKLDNSDERFRQATSLPLLKLRCPCQAPPLEHNPKFINNSFLEIIESCGDDPWVNDPTAFLIAVLRHGNKECITEFVSGLLGAATSYDPWAAVDSLQRAINWAAESKLNGSLKVAIHVLEAHALRIRKLARGYVDPSTRLVMIDQEFYDEIEDEAVNEDISERCRLVVGTCKVKGRASCSICKQYCKIYEKLTGDGVTDV